MDYYSAPEHIADPKSNLTYRFKLGLFAAITGNIGYFLINEGKTFVGIVILVFCVLILSYNFFGFKHCPSCDENMIPRAKKYCYDCWQRAKQANDPELNKDILNPEG